MTKSILSSRLDAVRESPTVAISGRARELKQAGQDIISLAAGEPDFDTPPHIRQAAIDAMERGETHYTASQGIPELRQAVCEKFRRDNRIEYSPDEVIICGGGKQVIFNAMMATLEQDDEVIIQSPYWVSYPDIVLLLGGKPVIVNATEDDGFLLTPESLEQAITPKTRWLFLNSPNNPCGSVYSRAHYQALGEVLEKYPDVMVMSDEIYETITYQDTEFVSFAEALPALKSRTLTVNGMSKSWAMTGWRIGYGAADQALIRAMTKIQGQSTLHPCSIAQWASVAALNGPREMLGIMDAEFDKRRIATTRSLNEIPGLGCFNPGGAFYLMVSVKQHLGRTSAGGSRLDTDSDWVMALMEEQGVAVVPGSAFGTDGYFRLSFATSQDELDEACERIARFCAGIGDQEPA